jgi:chemotaxis signal transduction protein
MSRKEAPEATSAAALRRAFDASFAAAPPPPAAGFEDVLAIRLGSDPYLLRLSEIAGLHVDRQIVPVPTAHPGLLGIAALRGQILPVYDLGVVLGYAPGESPRWLVLGPAPRSISLAFAELEGPLRLERASFSSAGAELTPRKHVRGMVRVEAVVRSVVDIGSVLSELAAAASATEGAARNG